MSQDELQPQASNQKNREYHFFLFKGYRRIILLLFVLMIIFAGTYSFFLLVKPRLFPSPISQFKVTSCPFKPSSDFVGSGRNRIRCGYLIVPEDRSDPHSPGLRLAVAIFKTLDPTAVLKPVVYLNGEPGESGLEDLAPNITDASLDKITLNRDLILFDQRGVGYAQPSLDCPEVKAFQQSALGLSLDEAGSEYTMHYTAFVQACHDRLVHSGIRLNAFTTLENAADVHDLIHALGYKQVALFGVSYGTRLALTVMRLYPSDLQSIVLDSVVPPQLNFYADQAKNIQHAFDGFFHGCAAAQHCKSAYPQLQNVFAHLVTELDAHPVSVPTTGANGQRATKLLTGTALSTLLYDGLYDSRVIPQLPALLYQLSHHDYSFISQLPPDNLSPMSLGMGWSVTCSEDMAYTTPQTLATSVQTLQLPLLRSSLSAILQNDIKICQIWNVKPVPPTQKQPVTSTLPTLILSGEYDPVTPPIYGQLAARTLSKSFFFIFPGVAHDVRFSDLCPNDITLAFEENPTNKPTTFCIHLMLEPFL